MEIKIPTAKEAKTESDLQRTMQIEREYGRLEERARNAITASSCNYTQIYVGDCSGDAAKSVAFMLELYGYLCRLDEYETLHIGWERPYEIV